MAFILQLVIAVPAGVLSATHQDKLQDQTARFFAVIGVCAPDFWLATIAIVFLASIFSWIPPLGGVAALWEDPFVNLQQFFLPALILGISGSATLTRLARNTLLEVIRQDYIRTAFAKGLTARRVWYVHAVKNAMIPVITNAGSHLGFLLGGTVIIENIFALPGVGQLTLNAINHRDLPQLEINVLFLAFTFVMINLVVDLSYGWLDPRIRYQVREATMATEADARVRELQWVRRRPSRWRSFAHMARRKYLGTASAVAIVVFVVVAVFAPSIAPYDPIALESINRLDAPSAAHLLGTDELGRDQFRPDHIRSQGVAHSGVGFGSDRRSVWCVLRTHLSLYRRTL